MAFSRGRDGVTKLYIDGAVVAEQRAQAVASGARRPACCTSARCSRAPDLGQVIMRFNGSLDEVMVYDRALLDSEVAAIAAGVVPVSDPAVGPVGAN